MSAISYRPEIDGLRAVAVVPVILFHMGVTWIAGGFLGVDVFFVISGYLITSLIRLDLERGTFSFRRFWGRRVRRILPALTVVVAATLVVGVWTVFRPELVEMARQGLAALLSGANVYTWMTTGDYWGTAAEKTPFLHTWSLSVEEQYYLLFPLLVAGLFALKGGWLRATLVLGLVGSLAAFLYGVRHDVDATFYLLPTRAWELLTGAVLAYLAPPPPATRVRASSESPEAARPPIGPEAVSTPSRSRPAGPLASEAADGRSSDGGSVQAVAVPASSAGIASWLGVAGLGLLVTTYALVPELDGGVAVAVAGAALVIAFARSGPAHAVLSWAPFVHVGRISYSLYLWHWPVLVFAERWGLTFEKLWLALPIYGLALLSYALVEVPARQFRFLFLPIVAAFLVACGFAAKLGFSGPFYDASEFQTPVWEPFSGHPNLDFYRSEAVRLKLATTRLVEVPYEPTAYVDGGILRGPGDGPPEVVVLGDSHCSMWSAAIDAATSELGVRTSFYGLDGVTPFVHFPLHEPRQVYNLTAEQRYAYDKARCDWLKAWKPKLVIIAARWDMFQEAQIEDTLKYLAFNTPRVLLVESPPCFPFGDRNAIQQLCFEGIRPRPGEETLYPCVPQSEADGGRGLIRALAAKHPFVSIVPTYDLYARGPDRAVILDGAESLYLDDDHLVKAGALRAVPRLKAAIGDAVRPTPAKP